MANLTVIDDTNVEVAVLVDTDDWQPLAVCAVGPNRVNLLQAFVDSVPFDLALLKPEALREAFSQFLQSAGVIDLDAPLPPAPDNVGDDTGSRNDAESTLAEQEATNHADVPDEQPADTDVEADEGSQTETVSCYNCNGTGKIDFGDGEPPVRCGMCKGTGSITVAVHNQ